MANLFTQTASLERVLLEQVRRAVAFDVPDIDIANFTMQSARDYLRDCVVVAVRQLMWGLKETDIETDTPAIYKHPADWWEAFKARWFPARLLKRFPVVYHTEVFTTERHVTYKVCPHLQVDPKQTHLQFFVQKGFRACI